MAIREYHEIILDLEDVIKTLHEENARLKKSLLDLDHESRRFRGGIANSKIDCVYCGLSKDDMAKCASGFPGCGRADDIVCDPDWIPPDIS